MLNAGMLTSNSEEWATPQAFFERLDAVFHFDLDVCATPQNAKCPKFFTRKENGLLYSWGEHTCFMNPPYGRQIGSWVKKAYEEAQKGTTTVALLPARTDTKWFQDYCLSLVPGSIHFVRGRLHFNDAKEGAPFPSCVVLFSKFTVTNGFGFLGDDS